MSNVSATKSIITGVVKKDDGSYSIYVRAYGDSVVTALKDNNLFKVKDHQNLPAWAELAIDANQKSLIHLSRATISELTPHNNFLSAILPTKALKAAAFLVPVADTYLHYLIDRHLVGDPEDQAAVSATFASIGGRVGGYVGTLGGTYFAASTGGTGAVAIPVGGAVGDIVGAFTGDWAADTMFKAIRGDGTGVVIEYSIPSKTVKNMEHKGDLDRYLNAKAKSIISKIALLENAAVPLRTEDSSTGEAVAYNSVTAKANNFVIAPSINASAENNVSLSDLYIIQSGDTLSELAQRFGTTVEALAEANGVTDPNRIYAGQSLNIPTADGIKEVSLASQEVIENFAASQGLDATSALKRMGQDLIDSTVVPGEYNWVSTSYLEAVQRDATLGTSMFSGSFGIFTGQSSFDSEMQYLYGMGSDIYADYDVDTDLMSGILGPFSLDLEMATIEQQLNEVLNSAPGSCSSGCSTKRAA